MTGVNSSSISVSWDHTQSDCYPITHYLLTCQDTKDGNIKNRTSIDISTASDSYSVTFTGLPPDTSFNCSVQVAANTSLYPASSDVGNTLPTSPPKPPVPLTTEKQSSPSTISLDLSALRDSLSPAIASHLWIVIIRLVSPTLPVGSADDLYPDASLFVDSPRSGSPMSRPSDAFYQPYLAAELTVGSLPSVFAIGDRNSSSTITNRDQVKIPTTYNGPLNETDYYTCFFRVFSYSSQLGKQYSVFTSSAYLIPIQPTSSTPRETTATSLSTEGTWTYMYILCISICTEMRTCVHT